MAKREIIQSDGEMFDPPHPGEVLKGLHMQPIGLTIKEVAERLGVERKALSRLINGHTGVTAEMAIRLGRAFNTTPDLWLGMQRGYDLWHAKRRMQRETSRIKPFEYHGDDASPGV